MSLPIISRWLPKFKRIVGEALMRPSRANSSAEEAINEATQPTKLVVVVEEIRPYDVTLRFYINSGSDIPLIDVTGGRELALREGDTATLVELGKLFELRIDL